MTILLTCCATASVEGDKARDTEADNSAMDGIVFWDMDRMIIWDIRDMGKHGWGKNRCHRYRGQGWLPGGEGSFWVSFEHAQSGEVRVIDTDCPETYRSQLADVCRQAITG